MNSTFSETKVYRGLLELCDFLLIPTTAEDRNEAGKAVLARIQASREGLDLEHQVSPRIEDAFEALTMAAEHARDNSVDRVQINMDVIKARELIERELNALEIPEQFTFDDTLKQIESLCGMIRVKGPDKEDRTDFDNASIMLDLIAEYRRDPSPGQAGEIMALLKELEKEDSPRIETLEKRTNRLPSQFKRIWSSLMRSGIDVMHPNKAWLAICEYLRDVGEPEDRLPSKEYIEKLFREWTN